MGTTGRLGIPLSLIGLLLGPSTTAVGQAPESGDDMRRVTVTVQWSAESLLTSPGPPSERGSWGERLDATVALDLPALLLPGGPFANQPGPRMIRLLPGREAVPSVLRVATATLTGRYAGRLLVDDKGTCDSTAAYQPGDVVVQGGASPGLAALVLYFSRDSLVGLLLAARPFAVRTTTATACGSTVAEQDRTITAAFGAPLLGRTDSGRWTVSVTRTADGYTGTARAEQAEALDPSGEIHLTRQLRFAIRIAGASSAAAVPPRPDKSPRSTSPELWAGEITWSGDAGAGIVGLAKSTGSIQVKLESRVEPGASGGSRRYLETVSGTVTWQAESHWRGTSFPRGTSNPSGATCTLVREGSGSGRFTLKPGNGPTVTFGIDHLGRIGPERYLLVVGWSGENAAPLYTVRESGCGSTSEFHVPAGLGVNQPVGGVREKGTDVLDGDQTTTGGYRITWKLSRISGQAH